VLPPGLPRRFSNVVTKPLDRKMVKWLDTSDTVKVNPRKFSSLVSSAEVNWTLTARTDKVT
jgi:hypothetical protein